MLQRLHLHYSLHPSRCQDRPHPYLAQAWQVLLASVNLHSLLVRVFLAPVRLPLGPVRLLLGQVRPLAPVRLPLAPLRLLLAPVILPLAPANLL